MTLLEQLAARADIMELKARYCRLLDTRQWEAWGALFTDDVAVNLSDDVTPDMGIAVFSGRALMVEQTRQLIDASESVHHVHGLELAFADDHHASGIWSMYDRIVFPAGSPMPFRAMTAHGFYHEDYMRAADGWRIASLRLQRLARAFEPIG
jgi:hypothetical protein